MPLLVPVNEVNSCAGPWTRFWVESVVRVSSPETFVDIGCRCKDPSVLQCNLSSYLFSSFEFGFSI